MSTSDISRIVKQKKIQWIQAHVVDLFGRLRVLHFPVKRFLEDNIIQNGFGFDGSSVGFSPVEKSDMIAYPDPNTFLVLPHEKCEARIWCTVFTADRKPFAADPRYILQRALDAAKTQGFNSVLVSPEMEFFLLDPHRIDGYEIPEKKGYFAPPSLDNGKAFRRTVAEYLEQSGYQVKYHHHETARFQHELEITRLQAMDAADFCIYFKYLTREIARRQDLQVTFMPKPYSDDAGNGMHMHVALYKNGRNIFYDADEQYTLSQTARYFIGGVLDHARGMALFANPTINSYKRLIPDFEAPIYVAWAQHNRSCLIRIAEKKDIDIEVRNGDPAANPYIMLATIIHAGLAGIKKKITCAPVEQNIYNLSKKRLHDIGIQRLPLNLMEALQAFQHDPVIQRAIGKEAAALFCAKKKDEWRRYMTTVTDLDYEFYFHV